MRETLDSKMNSLILLRIEQANSSRATPIYTLGGYKSKINETVYELTDAIYKALSSFSYSGRTLREVSDFLMWYKNKKVKGCKGLGDGNWKRKTFLLVRLPEKVAEIQSRIQDEEKSDELLLGERLKIILPSDNTYIWTTLEF